MMYRAIFSRDQDNPLTGGARYRVIDSYWAGDKARITVMDMGAGEWGLLLNQPRQIGSYINPTRALKETLATQHRTDERTGQMNQKKGFSHG